MPPQASVAGGSADPHGLGIVSGYSFDSTVYLLALLYFHLDGFFALAAAVASLLLPVHARFVFMQWHGFSYALVTSSSCSRWTTVWLWNLLVGR